MATLTAPGNALVKPCDACDHTGRDGLGKCFDCSGTGYALWHACPRCASLDWAYVNGRTEAGGMACRSCGASWAADYPGWVVQVLPDSYVRKAS